MLRNQLIILFPLITDGCTVLERRFNCKLKFKSYLPVITNYFILFNHVATDTSVVSV